METRLRDIDNITVPTPTADMSYSRRIGSGEDCGRQYRLGRALAEHIYAQFEHDQLIAALQAHLCLDYHAVDLADLLFGHPHRSRLAGCCLLVPLRIALRAVSVE